VVKPRFHEQMARDLLRLVNVLHNDAGARHEKRKLKAITLICKLYLTGIIEGWARFMCPRGLLGIPTKTSPRFLSFSPFSTVTRGHDVAVPTLRLIR